MDLARFRRLAVLLAVLAMVAGQFGQAVAAAHWDAGPAAHHSAAAAPMGDCEDCAKDGMTTAHCHAVCGFAAIMAATADPPPAAAARDGLPPDRRPPGWRSPPDPHPPKPVSPV